MKSNRLKVSLFTNALHIICKARADWDHLTTSHAWQYATLTNATPSPTRPTAPNYTSWKWQLVQTYEYKHRNWDQPPTFSQKHRQTSTDLERNDTLTQYNVVCACCLFREVSTYIWHTEQKDYQQQEGSVYIDNCVDSAVRYKMCRLCLSFTTNTTLGQFLSLITYTRYVLVW